MNSIDINKNLGQNLKKLRLGNSLNQKELGDKAGYSNTYICDIEMWRKSPNIETIVILAKVLGISLDCLIDTMKCYNKIQSYQKKYEHRDTNCKQCHLMIELAKNKIY